MNYQSAPILYQNKHGLAETANRRDPLETALETNQFDLLKSFQIFRTYLKMIAIFLLVGFIFGLTHYFFQEPRYRAQAKVEILTSGARVIEDLEISTYTNDIRGFETARQKFLTRELAENVVQELELEPSAVPHIQQGLSASIMRNTNIILVSFVDPDPDRAANIVNRLTQSFISENLNRNRETSKLASTFLARQVQLAKERLQVSEQALVEYAQDSGITLTGGEEIIIRDSIKDMNAALSKAVQERLSAQRYAEQVKAGNARSLPAVFESNAIQITKQKIAELRATYQENLSTLKPNFPAMRRLNAQIQELEKQVSQEVGDIAKSVEIKLAQANAKEETLRKELTTLEEQQSVFQNKNIQYTILKREVDSNRSQYDSLIGKLNDIGVSAELNISSASIIETALPPREPVSPNLYVNLLAALALSCLFAGLVITLRELLNDRLASDEEIEQELQLSNLGTIPYVGKENLSHAIEDMSSEFSEAYRNLRTSLHFTAPDDEITSIAVTSHGISEGKSTSSYKLATDFAALGRKVLVIDADLRKPNLHRIFDLPNGVGLSNLLSNVMCSDDVISLFRQTDDENITFLSAGTVPPNPVDLLASQKMALTLHYCAKKFDLIILDCPPVLNLSDAPILANQADATLMVVSYQSGRKNGVKGAVARLRSAGANIIGTVMTMLPAERLQQNYPYRYMADRYHSYPVEKHAFVLDGYGGFLDEKHNEYNTPMQPHYEKPIL